MATLDILSGTTSVTFAMDDSPRVIKVDYVNYALQVGAGTNCTATNAFEFCPDETVPSIRPGTLETVWVRRQHLVDTAKLSPKHQVGSVFYDPMLATPQTTSIPDAGRITAGLAANTTTAPTTSDNIDDDVSSFLSMASADAEEIRNQNTSLRKRRWVDSDASSQLSYRSYDDTPEPRRSRPPSTGFRPSSTQLLAHARVVHSSHTGKDPQELLELTQHSSHVFSFLATPPVLRGLFEFGFGDRGLELMHCKRATKADKIAAKEKGVNMTDFSEKNVLSPAAKPRDRADVVDALRSLRLFGRYFYNDTTNELIDTAASFVDEYTSIPDDDVVGWNHVALWIAEKFGKYTSLLVCNRTAAAQRVVTEFTRHDEALARFNDLRQPARPAPTTQRPRPDDGARRSDGQHQ